MTPEEKAKELIDKFETVDDCDVHYFDHQSPCVHQAKQCAIICVEQAIQYHPFPNEPDDRSTKFHEYWKEVLEQIKKS